MSPTPDVSVLSSRCPRNPTGKHKIAPRSGGVTVCLFCGQWDGRLYPDLLNGLSHSPIVGYDQSTRRVRLNNGGVVTLELVCSLNIHLPIRAIEAALIRGMPPKPTVTANANGSVKVQTVYVTKAPTPQEALNAILAEVKLSDDPRKAAQEWLTKVTTEIAAIVRETDEA